RFVAARRPLPQLLLGGQGDEGAWIWSHRTCPFVGGKPGPRGVYIGVPAAAFLSFVLAGGAQGGARDRVTATSQEGQHAGGSWTCRCSGRAPSWASLLPVPSAMDEPIAPFPVAAQPPPAATPPHSRP